VTQPDPASEMPTESEVAEEPTAVVPPADPGPVGEGDQSLGEPGEPGDVELEDDLTRARRDLTELTTDLQRLQAEYLNYKRRVERDRELVRENATYAALTPIVEVLDNIDRAREHGPLDDGFKTVAEQLERVVTRLGLTRFGAVGDPFDPTVHEALSHIGEDPEVTVTTCKVIAKAGYKIGDRVVRAAQVLVVDPVSEPTDNNE
jgi:molecular chaperone GrpE